MPLLDMPLKDLQAYKGINPCPPDLYEYWQRAIREMEAVDPDVQLVPADFPTPVADCYDLYYTGIGNARIHAKLLLPKTIKSECPAVVQFHGYGASSGDWFDKLLYPASGVVMASMDCRGQGGTSQDTILPIGNTKEGMLIRGIDDPNPDNMHFRAIFMDAVQLIRILMDMPQVDAARIATCGGSQGGALSIVAAALEPRVNRVASAFPFLSDYKRVWEMDLDKDAYRELSYYFRYFDPNHLREDEVFTRLGYIDVHHLAPWVKSPVMMFTGLMDNICPPSTQFAIYNNLTCPKEMVLYPDYGHEYIPNLDDRVYQYVLEML